MSVRCLSIHSGYRCRHTGACCSGVFAIPAEAHVVQITTALGLQPSAGLASLFVRRPGAGDAEFLSAAGDGICVFLEEENGRLCTIHRRAGPDALPTACRHFPRVFLQDARGMFLSLSHFCPTAAAMLMDERPLTIVEAGSPLALDGRVEAFDAVDALPPLLRPEMLMDLDAYDGWERASVETLARNDLAHEDALGVIAAATETMRGWKAGDGPLASHVGASFAAARVSPAADHEHPQQARRLKLIDPSHSWEGFAPPLWDAFDRPIKRYLAAKLFGNRIAYEARGLRSIVEWLRVCLALLRHEAGRLAAGAGTVLDQHLFIEAVRATDLLLVHRVDTLSLARRLEPLEHQS